MLLGHNLVCEDPVSQPLLEKVSPRLCSQRAKLLGIFAFGPRFPIHFFNREGNNCQLGAINAAEARHKLTHLPRQTHTDTYL